MKSILTNNQKEVLLTVLMFSAVSTVLLLIRMLVSGSVRLWFLQWNLFLAWLPLIFAFLIYKRVRTRKDLIWQNGLLAFLWLVFLPNTFYIITDLIHLQSSGEVGLLYDTAMITSFVLNGLLLGYMSIYIIQRVLNKFIEQKLIFALMQVVLLLSAFAIYLGRYLRWNTWDIVANPAGLLFDVSDRIINPGTHVHTFVVTGVFFVLLSSTYIVLLRLYAVVGAHVKQ
ncbi:DUF1361 domain-containing protein [Candidatus Saccharibacteria bacterium]|nr:DUF1361 domain-containing protein [Candidatus Saccharibacteria bacterium]